MEKRLLSKRDISINLYLLENDHGLLESVMMDPQHLIRLQMEVNPATREIVDANSTMVNGPFALCRVVEDRALQLIGLTIERGILKKVNHAVGGGHGCVHLRELAVETINFAATALVGIEQGFGLMDPGFARKDPASRFAATQSLLQNTCNSYSFPYEKHEEELSKYKQDDESLAE